MEKEIESNDLLNTETQYIIENGAYKATWNVESEKCYWKFNPRLELDSSNTFEKSCDSKTKDEKSFRKRLVEHLAITLVNCFKVQGVFIMPHGAICCPASIKQTTISNNN